MSTKIPPKNGGSGGTENRGQILPSKAPEDTGYMLPNYDFAGNLRTPRDVGVKRGGDFGDVISAAKGIIYYTDVIGFGKSTNSITADLPYNLLGINFFMKTGMTCTNGAEMWSYFQGIPDGSALGKTVKKAINSMGYPDMAGLAPGILEDTKAAMNPEPIIRSMFGSVYPVCELETKQVGDDRGLIKDPNTGDIWVHGDVDYTSGIPRQTRWVQKRDRKDNPVFVDRGEFDKTPKEYNPDGSRIVPPPPSEDFRDQSRGSLLVAVVLFALAFAITHRSR
jgi:hypothetical protein